MSIRDEARAEEREKAAQIAKEMITPGRVTTFTAAGRNDTARQLADRTEAEERAARHD